MWKAPKVILETRQCKIAAAQIFWHTSTRYEKAGNGAINGCRARLGVINFKNASTMGCIHQCCGSLSAVVKERPQG